MKRRKSRQASQAQQSRLDDQATAMQLSSQHSGITLTDLPSECLHLVCEHLGDSDSKHAAMRSCKALKSAVLEACTVLLKMQFPRQRRGRSGPRDSEKQHAQLLQQAKKVALEFHFDEENRRGKPRAVGDMLAWLAEMQQQCKGPLTSVCKLTLTGKPKGVMKTLPDWVPSHCPNLVHLAVTGFHFDSEKCDMDKLASCVYTKLSSVHLKESYLDFYREQIVPHISALLDAPHVTDMTLSLGGHMKQSLAQKECHLKTLHLLGEVNAGTLTQLPYKGVEHLVIGDLGQTRSFRMEVHRQGLAHVGQLGQALKNACTHLDLFSKVTLSTDAGIDLACYDTKPEDAVYVLPLLKFANPFKLTSDMASGVLRISGLERVTTEFVEKLCSSLPPTLTTLSFRDCMTWECLCVASTEVC